MEERRKAMMEMPKLIKAWKRVSQKYPSFSERPIKSCELTYRIGRKEKLDQMAQINYSARGIMDHMPYSGGHCIYSVYFYVLPKKNKLHTQDGVFKTRATM